MKNKFKMYRLVPTDTAWWDGKLESFRKNSRFEWTLRLAKAIKDYGLPPGLSLRTANIGLTRAGFGFHFSESGHSAPDGWTKTDIAQLRAIARLPLLKKYGWKACASKAQRIASDKKRHDKETSA